MRFQTVALTLATVTALVFGIFNFRQLWVYRHPSDGVVWVASAEGVTAAAIQTAQPERSAFAIQPGDRLDAIDGRTMHSPAAVARALARAGIGRPLDYRITRDLVPLDITVRTRASRPLLYRYRFEVLVGLLYLAMGLFVLLRRYQARKSAHFYLFCLASFVLYAFHYTGKLNLFDWTVFWSNEAALLLTPALFLHFALTFPERRGLLRRVPSLLGLVYLPAALLLLLRAALTSPEVQSAIAKSVLSQALDRADYVWMAAGFLSAAVVFSRGARRSTERVVTQQLQWMTHGTLLAIIPFTLLYVLPFLGGAQLTDVTSWAVLPLIVIPLAFGYAIMRYRLMDVEIVFRRGMAYTLATAAVVVVYFGLIAAAALLVRTRLPHSGTLGWLLAIVVTAFLFDPVKHWIQERLDRLFYRERYDYRRTLIEFGREISGEPDLDRLLTRLIDRLGETLGLERAAIFLADADAAPPVTLARARGWEAAPSLDLAFLERPVEAWRTPLFFAEPRRPLGLASATQAAAVAELGLRYYVPCISKDRLAAVLGLGQTRKGEMLSSEDVALVETLAGYVAIAIENARLYARLQEKVREYERLKDFNENIVESIHVGVVAVDLDDRIESWNAQMEVLTARPRGEALGCSLPELLGAEFGREYRRARQSGGIRNLYKFRLSVAGEEKTVNLAIAPLVNRRFEVAGQIVLIDDITGEVELEQRLAQSERLSSVGLLAAGVAHEVNTPLAVISSYTQMLAKQLRPEDPKGKVLEKITQQTFRASEIISNLLNFSRTGGGEFQTLDVNQVLRDTLALLEHPLKTARVSSRCDFGAGLPPVFGNAGKLQQVFLNLILNARDAMPQGGVLEIRTALDGDGVHITVADSGEGIPRELHHRIFDPFFTTKQAQRQNGGFNSGTGLGLAVTYGIVQEHSGTIVVESELEKGTTFRLQFPAMKKVVHA